MKIDFLIPALVGGGAERVMVILANHFALKGHDVALISFNEGEAYEVVNVQRVRLHLGRIRNHKVRSLYNLFNYYWKKEHRPRVLISFLTHNNLIGILCAKIFGLKIIISEHNSHLRMATPKWLTNIGRRFLYRKADFVTVLTAFDLDYYKKRKCNVVVMPNPCTFKSISDNGHTREKTILAVGSLDRYNHKGFDNLIMLINPILKNYPDWNLKIIGGGGNGEPFLRDLVAKEGLQERIIFEGFQTNVADYMKNAAIFILPSRYEGLPMVLLEAMSQGMACIAYDCKTGPSDMIQHNINGLLIPDQDVLAMQKGLHVLLNDSELRQRLGETALKSLNDYTLETVAAQWETLFEQVAK